MAVTTLIDATNQRMYQAIHEFDKEFVRAVEKKQLCLIKRT